MSSTHGGWAKSAEEEDRVETLIRKSGCWDNHISVVDCMGEHSDWRKCQKELEGFKGCMSKGLQAAREQQKEKK